MSSTSASNGVHGAAAAAPQVTIDNWINGAPCKPVGGKYMALWQPRDGTQTGQVALSTKEVNTRAHSSTGDPQARSHVSSSSLLFLAVLC